MPIWSTADPLATGVDIAGSLVGHLGIEIVEAGDDFLRGRMPVDERTRQPFGLLHGGASVVLAESLASQASWLVIDRDRFQAVGLEINANHLRGVRDGHVTGTARPIHLGRTTHVWEIRIEDAAGRLVCISRCTTAIVPNRAASEAKP